MTKQNYLPHLVGATLTPEDLAAADAAHLWHPWSPARASAETLVVTRAEGWRVTDARGRTFVDAKSSGLNANLGYGNVRVVAAMTHQLRELMTYDLGEGTSAPPIHLARRIAGLTAPDLDRTFFCNSGSEANEAAFRIARFHHAIAGEPQRTAVVSVGNAYHGSTFAAAASAPGPTPVGDISAPGTYVQAPAPRDDPDGHGLVGVVEQLADRTAAVVLEPVQGRGVHELSPAYLRAAREVCDRSGALLVIDEVMTGFGRTGTMFAHEDSGIVPDVLTSSKGLAAGYASIGAVTTIGRVFAAFEENRHQAGFVHGHTHSGHATACAAALAVLDEIEQRNLLDAVRARGEQLHAGLHGLSGPVVEVRGRGLLQAVELEDRDAARALQARAFERGVIVRRMGSTIVIAPPFIVPPEAVDEILASFAP